MQPPLPPVRSQSPADFISPSSDRFSSCPSSASLRRCVLFSFHVVSLCSLISQTDAKVSFADTKQQAYIHTKTHTYTIYIYIYIFQCSGDQGNFPSDIASSAVFTLTRVERLRHVSLLRSARGLWCVQTCCEGREANGQNDRTRETFCSPC